MANRRRMESETQSTGFEPDLPSTGSSPRQRHDDSLDSIFDDQASPLSDDLPIIENPPHNAYNPNGTNDLYTTLLIVNAALGAGLLNFPKAFDEAGGVLVAILVQAVLIVFILAALYILAYAADRTSTRPASTIQEVFSACCGKFGRISSSVCVAVYCFGTCVTFLIMIGDQFDRIFASLVGPDFCHKFYMNRDFTMTITGIVCILPFCFSKRIDFLKWPSLLGVLAILYLVGLIVFEYFYGNFTPGHIKHWPSRWTDVFLVVPDICFGYQCHVSVIPIYSCMKHRNIKHFSCVSFSAITLCALCYTGAAAFGYLTFGSKVNPDILLSYDAQRPEVMIGIIAMALKTISTYPILLFCGREALNTVLDEIGRCCGTTVSAFQADGDHEVLVNNDVSASGNSINDVSASARASSERRVVRTDSSSSNSNHVDGGSARSCCPTGSSPETTRRAFIVIIWFAGSCVLAICVPNIGQAICLLGCLAAIFIFVIPGLSLARIIRRSDPSLLRKQNKALFAIGVIFVIIGTLLFGVVLTQDIQALRKISTIKFLRYYFQINQLPCSGS